MWDLQRLLTRLKREVKRREASAAKRAERRREAEEAREDDSTLTTTAGTATSTSMSEDSVSSFSVHGLAESSKEDTMISDSLADDESDGRPPPSLQSQSSPLTAHSVGEHDDDDDLLVRNIVSSAPVLSAVSSDLSDSATASSPHTSSSLHSLPPRLNELTANNALNESGYAGSVPPVVASSNMGVLNAIPEDGTGTPFGSTTATRTSSSVSCPPSSSRGQKASPSGPRLSFKGDEDFETDLEIATRAIQESTTNFTPQHCLLTTSFYHLTSFFLLLSLPTLLCLSFRRSCHGDLGRPFWCRNTHCGPLGRSPLVSRHVRYNIGRYDLC